MNMQLIDRLGAVNGLFQVWGCRIEWATNIEKVPMFFCELRRGGDDWYVIYSTARARRWDVNPNVSELMLPRDGHCYIDVTPGRERSLEPWMNCAEGDVARVTWFHES